MAHQFTPVQQVLMVCQARADEIDALEVRERLDSLEDYAEMSSEDVTSLASKLERRTIAQGRTQLPTKLIKNLQALCFWCSERIRKGEPLEHNEFTAATLAEAKVEMRRRAETKSEPPSIKPDRFKPGNWKIWSRQFDLYLSNHRGEQFAPMDYIIRREPLPPEHVHTSERERKLYDFPLNGPRYKEDNMTVYRMLSDLVGGTEAQAWIAPFDRAQNGREAWIALKEHYEGGGNAKRKMTEAEALIDSIHYKNESVFSFETFSTRLIEAYRDLEDTECAKTPYEQVRIMLDKIRINSTEAEIHKNHVRQHFRADISGAVTYLGTEFARMFPQVSLGIRRPRDTRTVASTAGTERDTRQRTGPESRQQGMRDQPETVNGVTTFFGVDVTDVGRTFSSQEMDKLSSAGQRYLFTERDRLGLSRSSNRSRYSVPGRTGGRGGGRGRFPGRGSGGRYIRAVSTNGDNVSTITEPATTRPPAPTREDDSTAGDRGSTNGSRFGAGNYNNTETSETAQGPP